MAVFRVERNTGYTVMSNHHLRNKELSLKAKADKERGKEKPSIRAQLKADKERTGKKKNAKQKSQDLERS